MTVKYYAILTNQGAARLANATMLGSKLNLTQMAVGDANGVLPTPDPAQTKLINQKRIAPLNLLSVDPNNQSQIIAEQIIPENEGGFWIREIGLYDDEGVLIAVANCPETYKPQLQEGSGRTQTIRMILVVSNTEAITLKIDPSVVLATRKYVDDKISEHEQSRRHPDASLTAKGFTQLSSATNSTSETLAATPRAVKVAYDLANGKYTAQDATTARKGLVQLSSATNSDSETLAATPKAVKTAYDLANGKYTAQDATTARKGLVQLSSATNSDSETLAATPKAVKTAYDLANGKYTAQDATTARKGLVQLSSATNSTSETQAATPKAVKAVYDLANGKQPADATLTALAGLATAADKLPYFTGNDVASLATLTKVGRDILAKSTVAAVIEYLGLQETVNRAGNAVQKNGDTLSGGLTFENNSILAWIRNTDWAKIGFKNDADGDTDSYMWFETGDNGNEYFKWRSRQSTTTKDLMTLKWDALNILVNAVINGCFGVGTTNALGGSSIVLGDNDTGFKQNGDGILDVYANSQRVFRFQNGVAIAFKNIQAGDSKKFSLSSSNTSTKNITFNLWGASTRPVVAELGDEAGWHFYSQRNTDNSVIFAVNGQMQPSNWGNFDSRYVKDVRLGTRVVQLMARGGRYEKAGHTITGLRIIGEVDGDDEAIFRPIQKYINGTWYNVAQV
ncbi:tail fiber protein [Escherichia coli]|nr:tail fiber protein [Escherichia coli]